jgi:hypothetical protein
MTLPTLPGFVWFATCRCPRRPSSTGSCFRESQWPRVLKRRMWRISGSGGDRMAAISRRAALRSKLDRVAATSRLSFRRVKGFGGDRGESGAEGERRVSLHRLVNIGRQVQELASFDPLKHLLGWLRSSGFSSTSSVQNGPRAGWPGISWPPDWPINDFPEPRGVNDAGILDAHFTSPQPRGSISTWRQVRCTRTLRLA